MTIQEALIKAQNKVSSQLGWAAGTQHGGSVLSLKWTARMFNRYHFALNLPTAVILIVVSYFGGCSIYESLMAKRQNVLFETYQSVDVLCDILAENPKFAQGPCDLATALAQSDEISARKSAADSPYNIHVLRYLFEKAELYDVDDVDDSAQLVDASEMPGTAYLAQIFMGKDPSSSQFLKLGGATSLELIIQVATSLGDEGCVPPDGAPVESNLPKILALGMSQIQLRDMSPYTAIQDPCEFTMPAIDGAVHRANQQAISDNDLLSYLWTIVHANNAETDYAVDSDADQWGNRLDKVRSVRKIVIGNNGELQFSADDKDNLDPEAINEVNDTARKFSQFLMGKIHSNYLVAEERKQLVMFRGYEQHIMLCLLIFVLLVIFLRFIYRRSLESILNELNNQVLQLDVPNPDGKLEENVDRMERYRRDALNTLTLALLDYEKCGVTRNIVYKTGVMIKNKLNHPTADDVDKMRNALTLDTERLYNSRWIVRWTAITIPAFGFVGTVRGILQSLSQADIIVWASNQSERASAIGEISGELGLAFATTLIALVIGIAISVFNEHQTKNESNFVYLLEEVSSKFLDYRYRGIDNGANHAAG